MESAVTALLPDSFYIPGLGLLVVLVGTYIVGLVANVWLGAKFVSLGESLLNKVPLLKTVYGSIKDLLSYFDVSDKSKLNKPVLVYIEALNAHMLGFVTQSDPSLLPMTAEESEDKDILAVYLPMSYQVGGYMLFVPESAVSPLDMTIEEAMQYAITAGVSGSSAKK